LIGIAPSLLSADFARLGEEVQSVAASGAEWLHFDCMDGHFVDNLTFGPLIIQHLRPLSQIAFDVHLMVSNPVEHIDKCAAAGADHILIQRESDTRPIRLLERIRSLGKKAGLVYNPATSLADAELLLPYCDIVMLMSVEPGAGGQSFIPSALPRIRELRELIAEAGLDTLVSIDGGVNAETAPAIIEAGIDVLITGSWFFRHPGGKTGAVADLRAIASEHGR
jgi:ribulose-phosphate 3-epimerase